MNSYAFKLLSVAVFSLFVTGAMAADKNDISAKKPLTGKGDITVKKNTGGSLELSNINDDEDAELLIENKEKAKAEAPQPAPSGVDRVEIAPRNDVPRETAGAGRVEQRDASRFEGEELAGGAHQRGNELGGGYQENGGASTGANTNTNAAGGAAANAPKITTLPSAGDAQTNQIGPNPRPGTDVAVPSTADTTSTAEQEKYRNLMAQEAARAAATGTQGAIPNPAAVRRYIATDRATYQRAIGN
jgi:hypothetical protein